MPSMINKGMVQRRVMSKTFRYGLRARGWVGGWAHVCAWVGGWGGRVRVSVCVRACVCVCV